MRDRGIFPHGLVLHYPFSEIAGNVFVRVSDSCIIDTRVFPEYFNKHVKVVVATGDAGGKSGVCSYTSAIITPEKMKAATELMQVPMSTLYRSKYN